MASPTIRIVRPGAMTAVTPAPVTTHGITWQTQKNGPGSGQFAIALDDPAHDEIQINDVAIITRDSVDVAAILIELIHERTLDEQGGARQVATYSGRLVGAFMEWAVIEPALGHLAKPIEDDAIFDWRSPRYDPANDSWTAATEICTVAAARGGLWPTQPMAEEFTDTTGALMLWDSSGDETDAPDGVCLFYRDITITTGGRYGLELLMDNEGTCWVDGVQQLDVSESESYHRVSFKRIWLSAETHRFTWLVRNIPVVGSGPNPAALAYNLFKVDNQDRPQRDASNVELPPVAISDDSTFVLSYPDPYPGMTVGDIWEHLLDEVQNGTDRGGLDWIIPTFDADLDSNGDTWDRELGITTKTGTTTYLSFLDELVASGRISRWVIHPDGETFDLFAPGYSTRPGDVELVPAPVLDPRTGQVVTLDRKIT